MLNAAFAMAILDLISQVHCDKGYSTLLCLMSRLYFNLNFKAVMSLRNVCNNLPQFKRLLTGRSRGTIQKAFRTKITGLLKFHYSLCRSKITYCLINSDSFPGTVRDLQRLRNVQTGARLHSAYYSMLPALFVSGSKTVGARSWPFPLMDYKEQIRVQQYLYPIMTSKETSSLL